MIPDDIAIVERQRNVRVIVSIPARFSFADVRNARGERRVYAGRAVNLSPHAIALASPVGGRMGGRVIAHIDHLGKLEGLVTRELDRGFIMSVKAGHEERSRLAAKIEWLGQHKNFDVHDQRVDCRFVPANPHSRMILPDGSTENCLVLDLSTTGAAISADTIPEPGTILAIGTIAGRVVRHFEGGFAVQFIKRQSRGTIEFELL